MARIPVANYNTDIKRVAYLWMFRRSLINSHAIEIHVVKLQHLDILDAGQPRHFYNRFLGEAVLKRRSLILSHVGTFHDNPPLRRNPPSLA